jgi:hypothetical protein
VRKTATRKASFAVDFLLLFLLAAILIWPLFKVKYTDKWSSIESTFISDARFLKEHWPHPGWQPLWYGGTRFDYIYPPALRYGTAALAKFYPMVEARAYHIYVAFFYCFGIAAVYLLVRLGCESRGAAWIAATAAALLSPSFLFLPSWRDDSWLRHPTRLGVLVRYGEGPHMTAFALLPIALCASLLAMRRWRPGVTAAAAICCALVVSNNFYGAVALALCFPILLWSVWITRQDNRIWARALAIPVLAYGLTAFWLVPSYLRVTGHNLKLVSREGNTWSIWVALFALVAYMVITAKCARWKPDRFYLVFVVGLALFFSLDVLGNQYFGFRVAGEPSRLTPELDLTIILVAVEGLRRLWARDTAAARALALGIVLVTFATALPYVRRAWLIIAADRNYQERIEYKLTQWMADHLPGSRSLATGSVRFWYDAWRDLPQVGGGSDQGIVNQLVNLALVSLTGQEAESSRAWLLAFGVDAIIVHDKNSQEFYHDYVYPQSFATAYPKLFDNHQGDTIYGVPRRFPDLARVVETTLVERLPAMSLNWDPPTVRAYADALEHGPDTRARMQWQGTNAFRIEADVAANQSVVAQVAYDPQWKAESGGQTLPIRKDALGQMLIEMPPGHHSIRLVFDTPFENRVGQAVSALSVCITLALIVLGNQKEGRVLKGSVG